jgi:hypothetical protein
MAYSQLEACKFKRRFDVQSECEAPEPRHIIRYLTYYTELYLVRQMETQERLVH